MRVPILLVALSASVAAADPYSYKPFSPITDVCTRCTSGPQFDRISLKAGEPIEAHVVNENDQFYTLERFGELRVLKKDAVASVEKAKTPDPMPDYGDQILFNDGILLAGTLKDSSDPDRFTITVPPANLDHLGTKSSIVVVYKRGKVIFTGGGAPAPAPTSAPASAPTK